MESFKTIQEAVFDEIVEKKSRFIADVFPLSSQEEAEERLTEVKKKYNDARHHCFAYRIEEKGRIIERCSDDGEPSGTAGTPILTILQKKELMNTLVVVTRYFGGTLLGTGGLVRAYSEATIGAIQKANILEVFLGYEIEIELEYKDLASFQHYAKNNEITIIAVEYLEYVTLKIELAKKQKEKLFNHLIEHKFQIRKNGETRNKYIQKGLR